jgi:hypothetical protein
MSTRHVRRMLEAQGRMGIRAIASDEGDELEEVVEHRTASGFAAVALESDSDEEPSKPPQASSSPPFSYQVQQRPEASSSKQSSRKSKRGKKKATQAQQEADQVADDALIEALREAGALDEAAALEAASKTGAAEVEAAGDDPRLESLLSCPKRDLEPSGEFLRMFGGKSVRAAREERDADARAGLAQVDPEAAGLSLTRKQRRALKRITKGSDGKAKGSRVDPRASARSRSSGLVLLGEDAFSRDGGLDEVPDPPSFAGGGIRLVELACDPATGVRSFAYEHSSGYSSLQSQFARFSASYDLDSIFRLASFYPNHIDANLQVAEYFRSIGKLDEAGKAIRRTLLTLERAWLPSFRPWTGLSRLPYDVPENRALHSALWRSVQLVGRAGALLTAFSQSKLLLSLDPQRDPMRVQLAVDYYALRAQALDFVERASAPCALREMPSAVDAEAAAWLHSSSPLVPSLRDFQASGEPACPPLLLPNWAFSRALSLWRAALMAAGLGDPSGWKPVSALVEGSTRSMALKDLAALRAASDDPSSAAQGTVMTVMSASSLLFRENPDAPSLEASSSPAACIRGLYSHVSAWTPLGSLARAVLLFPGAVRELLTALEVAETDVGTAKFGVDTRRSFGHDDAGAAASEALPAGLNHAAASPALSQLDAATHVHVVAWQGLGRPAVDICSWKAVMEHPLFVRATAELEEADSKRSDAPASLSGLDRRLGKLIRVFVTRQSGLWKDSDALALLHRACLAAAVAYDEYQTSLTGSAALRMSPEEERERLLFAAFGGAENALLAPGLADAAIRGVFTVGSPFLAGAPGSHWTDIGPMVHYGAAVRAEYSDEVKLVADEELRDAMGVAEPAAPEPAPARGPPGEIDPSTNPMVAFLQAMLPWATAPGTEPPADQGGPLLEPVGDAELAAAMQAAEFRSEDEDTEDEDDVIHE